jgi:Fe-S oxidoreductase
MNILFAEEKIRADKLGICYLSRILKDASHKVNMLQDSIDPIEDYLRNNPVDFVMWSVSSGEQDWVLAKNKALKEQFKFTSVVGGPHFTYFPEQGEKDPYIDFVVRGPGEEVILDIVNKKITNKVIKGPIPDISKIKSPDRSILYKYNEFGKSPMKRFMTWRFCQHFCSYCFNHVFREIYKDEKDKIKQVTSVDRIISEIIDVKKEYGLEIAYFNDDNLGANKSWTREFCDKFPRIGIKFCGSVRAEDVDKDLLYTMAQAGCVFLNMALESGDPNTQRLLRRGGTTFEKVKEMAQIAMSFGIKIRIQNMIGLPVDNIMEDALLTLKCNQEISPTDSWVSVYQPYGKTDLAEYCVKKGFITSDYVAQGQYDRSQFNFPESEKIYRLSKLWWFFIVYKVDINFVRDLIEIPFDDQQMELIQDIRLKKSKKLLYNL